ncbi:hypothetical protein ACFLV4_02920 [Chloroflexota bacterium]
MKKDLCRFCGDTLHVDNSELQEASKRFESKYGMGLQSYVLCKECTERFEVRLEAVHLNKQYTEYANEFLFEENFSSFDKLILFVERFCVYDNRKKKYELP